MTADNAPIVTSYVTSPEYRSGDNAAGLVPEIAWNTRPADPADTPKVHEQFLAQCSRLITFAKELHARGVMFTTGFGPAQDHDHNKEYVTLPGPGFVPGVEDLAWPLTPEVMARAGQLFRTADLEWGGLIRPHSILAGVGGRPVTVYGGPDAMTRQATYARVYFGQTLHYADATVNAASKRLTATQLGAVAREAECTIVTEYTDGTPQRKSVLPLVYYPDPPPQPRHALRVDVGTVDLKSPAVRADLKKRRADGATLLYPAGRPGDWDKWSRALAEAAA